MNWSSGLSPLNTWPTSNSATSGKPRSALRCADVTRPGMRLGRMSDRSAAIGLASASSACPPPNNSACALAMNDQVTASAMPRAASARFALRVRTCCAVSTGLRGASPRSNGVNGTLSTPTMRTISSTMSALPSTSLRHDGIAIFTVSPAPAAKKPRCLSTRFISVSGTSRPDRRFTSVTGKSITRSSACCSNLRRRSPTARRRRNRAPSVSPARAPAP